MKILVVADIEEKVLWDHFQKDLITDVDLIISCGDLDPHYLEFLVTMTNVPLLYVHGNHDERYDENPPLGCTCIDDKLFEYQGLRIVGLGGCMRYRNGTYMYTEREMRRRIRRLYFTLRRAGGFDLLVTHAPAKGYGDLTDRAHRGFHCFNDFLEKWKPSRMLFGHVHGNYDYATKREHQHSCGTQLINAWGYTVIEM